jgi:hypothetical protein
MIVKIDNNMKFMLEQAIRHTLAECYVSDIESEDESMFMLNNARGVN